MTERSFAFRTPPDGIDVVHTALASLWADRPDIGEMDRMMFETALVELASNVIQHATSSTAIVCQVELTADRSTLTAVLTDSADPPEIGDQRRDMPDEWAESGRGLPFIQALVDRFEHRRSGGGNVWTLAKKLSSSSA